jgi:signal transduction histidine kinase
MNGNNHAGHLRSIMNTTAVTLAWHRMLPLDRIRGLFNGFGYVVMLTVVLNSWVSLQRALLKLLAADWSGFIRLFLSIQWQYFWETVPGLLLIPLMVNLAPRAGPWRLAWILGCSVPLWWWCLSVAAGVRFDWSWHSLGYVLDGFSSAGMVVGVCFYHSDSRAAADSLARTQIQRASLDAELQRAQLRLLRAQIEPHFLFNSLSVVRALARNDRAATVDMLDNLLRYFEAASPRLHEGEVPLAQELQLVEAYLAIYRARMGPRLAYSVDAPAVLGQERIPAMILLTLVENALKHGVGPAVEGGRIRVSAERQRDALLLKVADSGRGMEVRHGHGTGLANIRQRLRMMYGTKAVLLLRSAEPRGVVASVLLPLRQAL